MKIRTQHCDISVYRLFVDFRNVLAALSLFSIETCSLPVFFSIVSIEYREHLYSPFKVPTCDQTFDAVNSLLILDIVRLHICAYGPMLDRWESLCTCRRCHSICFELSKRLRAKMGHRSRSNGFHTLYHRPNFRKFVAFHTFQPLHQ